MLVGPGQARRGRAFQTPPGSKDSNGKDVPQGVGGPLPGFARLITALLTPNRLWHNCLMSRLSLALLFGILGFAAGTSYGKFIAPVEYVDTTPSSLRADYRTDYVLMVAERFHAGHDPDAALRQLSILGGESASAVCADAIRFAKSSAYAEQDIALLEELDRAMQAISVISTPTGTAP